VLLDGSRHLLAEVIEVLAPVARPGPKSVAADGSRRIFPTVKTAPTAVGGYMSMEYPR
jgi:hypothetical protein